MSKGFGELCEMEFCLRAMRLGLRISRPITESKYDVVVDNGKKLLRIQVKATRPVIRRNGYGVMVSYGKDSKKIYDISHIDFFAIFIEPVDVWFIVPVDFINCSKITFSPGSKKSKYAPYENAWHLIQ